jgi:cysteinyl-tRNA synthetase
MSQEYLKTETLDIHGGGRDLIFPHHENEIAQAEALTGKPFAKYWLHHGLLTINGQKMAKSLGNFVTIKDFITKYKDADILKLFFLSAHYSQPIDYNDKKIEETKQALDRIYIFLNKVRSQPKQGSLKEIEEIQEIKARFEAAMDDNFNTPEALASIFDLVKLANKNIEDLDFIYTAREILRQLYTVLGLSLRGILLTLTLTDREIESMISNREQARREKKYGLADNIRKNLEEKGIILEDTKERTTWRRKI